jgi:serine/threonine protein kinase
MQTTLPAGTILRNQYLVQELLAKGACSAVYRVNAVSLAEGPRGKRYTSTRFALKEVGIPDSHLWHHINLKAALLRGVDHGALPHIYEVFTSNKYKRLYFLMEYIEGSNLEQVRLQEPGRHLPLTQVMTIMAPILDAVSYLHRQQPSIIHQHIEPGNIILSKAGNQPVLVGFGVDNLSLQDDLPARRPMPGCAAPEQYDGAISTRTDIYGLGATFYTLLTGIVPADALHRKRLIESENIDPLQPVDQLVPAIPAHVAEAIQRAMSLDSNARFPTTEQFAQALQAEPVQQPPEAVTTGSTWQDQQAPPSYVEPADAEAQKPPVSVSALGAAPPSPDLPGRMAETPAPLPVKVLPRAPTARKRAALLLIALTLIVSMGVGTGFFLFATGHHNSSRAVPTAAALHKTALPATPLSTKAATPSSAVALVESYNGTIFDLSLHMTTKMSLAQIQQSWGSISGYFTGLHKNGHFKGSIDAARHIQFLVINSTGLAVFSFDGGVQVDGTIGGSFCSLNPAGHCAGAYGVWSAAPTSS